MPSNTGAGSPIDVTGLINGHSYRGVRVRAVNAVGAGPWATLNQSFTPVAAGSGGGSQALYVGSKAAAGAQTGPSWTITPAGANAKSVLFSGALKDAGAGGGGGASPATYPSRLVTSGRDVVDANGYIVAGPGRAGAKLLGQNVMFNWAQSDWNAMAAAGHNFVRWVIFLDDWLNGANSTVINSSAATTLDSVLSRIQTAGMYCMLDLHLNVGRVPSWFGGDNMAALAAQGQTLVEFLYNRYKNNPVVIGLGVNEPPENVNNNNTNTVLEGHYNTIHGWHRAIGSNWIAFISTVYAVGTPIYYSSLGHRSDGVAANPDTFNGIGGNVMYDVHQYFARDLRTSSTTGGVVYDGREYNGSVDHTNFKGVGDDNPYVASLENRLEQVSFWRGHKEMSIAYGVPIMCGEWGWPEGPTGENSFIADTMLAWDDAGLAAEVQWNFDVTPSNTVWCSYPNRVWRSSTLAWLADRT